MELNATIPLKDIKKIELYQNTGKLYMSQIKAKTSADYIINGGIYSFKTFKPFGNVKVDGKVVYNPGYTEYGYSWNNPSDFKYSIIPSPTANYLGCVGIIKDGLKQKLNYNADMGGSRQRSAIGINESAVVLYVCNGASNKTPEKLQDYCLAHGWDSGLMLDGGGSTQAIFDGHILNSAENGGKGRIVQNYILIYTHDTSDATQCPYKEPIVTIKLGSSGDGVKWVQWWLNKKINAGLVVDGAFGAKSVTALKQFQKSYGLTADGLCGARTRTALKK